MRRFIVNLNCEMDQQDGSEVRLAKKESRGTEMREGEGEGCEGQDI